MKKTPKNKKSSDSAYSSDMPMGLTQALARNPAALDRFANLSESEKESLINGVHGIRSKEEMRAYVDSFAKTDI